MPYTVRKVAELAGVSVRTLHHYDTIGLVCPQGRTAAGYRLYRRDDLERLQQVLFFKELGLGLGAIKAIMDDPGFDRRQALLEHKRLLRLQKDRIERLIRAVDNTLKSMEEGDKVGENIMFDGFDHGQYEQEVRQRWGHTGAYRESKERTKDFKAADWDAIAQEQTALLQAIAALSEGPPDDPQVLEAVGRMHRFINERFYTCPPKIFRGLGALAVTDGRFRATYEKIRPGFSTFIHEAVRAYCDRQLPSK